MDKLRCRFHDCPNAEWNDICPHGYKPGDKIPDKLRAEAERVGNEPCYCWITCPACRKSAGLPMLTEQDDPMLDNDRLMEQARLVVDRINRREWIHNGIRYVAGWDSSAKPPQWRVWHDLDQTPNETRSPR